MAYFGYPQAREDDAERALRAGLAVVGAVRRLQTPVPLQMRVGLATGLVVVGDLIGSGAAREEAVVGETPNLAARLQAVAEPDSVVIADSTRRLVGSLFEYQNLGEVELKGLPAPVAAFRVLGESRVGSRFEALRSGETPLEPPACSPIIEITTACGRKSWARFPPMAMAARNALLGITISDYSDHRSNFCVLAELPRPRWASRKSCSLSF